MVARFAFLILMILILGCEAEPAPKYEWKTIRVAATAYNSTRHQTDGDPFISAFGDSLKPGMKCIAVSRDLYRLGLKHNTFVTIEGLKGIYLVKDKMHKRWKNKIDIYLGTDIIAARRWGYKKIEINYRIEVNTIP